MNKKSLSFIAIVLISASFFQAMDENTNSSNLAPLKSAFKTPGSPRKTSSPNFSNTTFVVLIPHVNEYYEAGLSDKVWRSDIDINNTECYRDFLRDIIDINTLKVDKEKKEMLAANLLKNPSPEQIKNFQLDDSMREMIETERKILNDLNAQKKSAKEKAAHIENVRRKLAKQEKRDKEKEKANEIISRILG